MSEETLKNVIRRTMLPAEKAISYVFQGGEPTLRGIEFFEKAFTYQRQYNKHNITVQNSVQTNGYALDANWCRLFRDNHVLVGLSLDGTKEIYDSYRHGKDGQGTYDKVMAAVSLLDRYHVDYNIVTVVNKKVASNIEDIYQAYKKRGWKYQQYIACLDPLDERHGEKPYSLTPDLPALAGF